MSEEKESKWQEVLQAHNPQLTLFKAVEEAVGENLKEFLLDIEFQKGILWIKVSHPSLVQLLFMKKMAIMSKMRVLSTSLVVKDVRFLASPISPLSENSGENSPQESFFAFAPTGEVEGEVVEIQNERLKELMEKLSRSINEREESKKKKIKGSEEY